MYRLWGVPHSLYLFMDKTGSRPLSLGSSLGVVQSPSFSGFNVLRNVVESLLTEEDVNDEPRPSRMKAPDISQVRLTSSQRPIDYGHVGMLLRDKYGSKKGDEAYEYLFRDGRNTGWTVGANIQKEKIAMLTALNRPIPGDLGSVAYFPLWKEWMSSRGVGSPSGRQVQGAPASSSTSEEIQDDLEGNDTDSPEEEFSDVEDNPEDIPEEAEGVSGGNVSDLGQVPNPKLKARPPYSSGSPASDPKSAAAAVFRNTGV